MTIKMYAAEIRKEEGYGAIKKFSDRANVSYFYMTRLVAGEIMNLTRTTMINIIKASGGKITMQDFYDEVQS